jgi:hypothetical protein
MRLVLVVVLLAGCAGNQLALAPPSGVDLSGRWQLNEADSDDPQRLSSQIAGAGAAGTGSTGGQDGQGGRGGGRGGRGRGGGGMGAGGTFVAPLPPVSTMSEGLRWPGKQVEIKQVAGVVAITSAGLSQVFQPAIQAHHPGHRNSSAAEDAARDRDMRSFDRGDGPPPNCGWDGKTLVVKSREADDDHPPFEERYSLSDDGQRLIEVVGFKGGRSAGFTMFRVWDRSPAP